MNLSKVLVVIPCLNEAEHIGSLLLQILTNDPASATFLIIVADGGSRDGTRDIVTKMAKTYPNIVLMDNPKRLQSAGINLAVKTYGEGVDLMVRIDAHGLYPNAYVSTLCAIAQKMQAASVVVPMDTRGKGCFQIAVAAAQNSVLGTGGSSHRHAGKSQWIDHGHHAVFDLNFYRQLGGYDESFSHNEDAEYDARLAKIGGKIWLAGDVSMVYFPRRDPKSLFLQYFNYGKGRAKTVAKHKIALKLRQWIPLSIAPVCFAAIFAPFTPICAIPALGWAFLCIAFGLKLTLSQKTPCVALSGVAAMIMHLAWSLGYWFQTLKRSFGEVEVRSV